MQRASKETLIMVISLIVFIFAASMLFLNVIGRGSVSEAINKIAYQTIAGANTVLGGMVSTFVAKLGDVVGVLFP